MIGRISARKPIRLTRQISLSRGTQLAVPWFQFLQQEEIEVQPRVSREKCSKSEDD